jgi:hypothetical protein
MAIRRADLDPAARRAIPRPQKESSHRLIGSLDRTTDRGFERRIEIVLEREYAPERTSSRSDRRLKRVERHEEFSCRRLAKPL